MNRPHSHAEYSGRGLYLLLFFWQKGKERVCFWLTYLLFRVAFFGGNINNGLERLG